MLDSKCAIFIGTFPGIVRLWSHLECLEGSSKSHLRSNHPLSLAAGFSLDFLLSLEKGDLACSASLYLFVCFFVFNFFGDNVLLHSLCDLKLCTAQVS